MKKDEFKRVNLWLGKPIYDKIKDKADKQFLKVGTYLKQVILLSIVNNESNK
jgi:hypothetical protein